MKKLYFLTFLVMPLFLFAQGEANNWYFGQFAGVTFNTNPPTALTDGQLSTLEGCSSISDTSGNLVFYTDGRTVWDRTHTIMPNADYVGGTGLMGDPSSTSSGLIVPHPTDPNLYYIFTVDEPHQDNANAYPNQGPADENGNPIDFYDEGPNYTVPIEDDGFNNGFNYSLVDMTLRNGLGNVVADQKNIQLVTYNEDDLEEIKYKCAEKITAVVNANCNSIWVLTHFINRFYAFTIDENGVNPDPVISEIGPTIPLSSYRRGALGYMKASPEGDKLITANLQDTYTPPFSGNVYLYDFNNATGEVENPFLLKDDILAYGVEFSQDSKKVYASASGDLIQWDLDADDILGSEYVIPDITGQGLAIQLAPNGKIYLPSFSDRLNVINFPNNAGAAMDYSTDLFNGAINLQGNFSSFGLPPFIQSIFTSRVGIIEVGEDAQIETQLQLCEGDTYLLNYEHDTPATYQWYENGVLIEGETSSSLSIPINSDFTENLNYTLDVFPTNGDCELSGIANITINPLPDLQNINLTECVTNVDDFTTEFNLSDAASAIVVDASAVQNNSFSFFLSEEEASLDENPIANETAFTSTNDEIIFVRVEDLITGCFSISEIELRIDDYQIGESFEILRCDDNLNGIQSFDLTEVQVNLNAEIADFYLSINDALNDSNSISNPLNYQNTEAFLDQVFYRIADENCGTIGQVDLIVDNLPMLSEVLDYKYCIEQFPETISIQPNLPEDEANLYEYFWPGTNETSYQININEAGTYSVLVTEIETGCEAIQEIVVTSSGLASFDVITIDATRSDNSIEIIVDEESLGEYEFAIDSPFGPYQDSPLFENLTPGFYMVYARDLNGCGIASKEVALLGIMPFFTPNNDGVNDYWRILGFDRNRKARVHIFDRFGKLLYEFDEANRGWDGYYNGKPMLNNDYWYAIRLDDGRVLRGNFSLIR